METKRIDTDFYIDRMFGLPICFPVKAGIIQEFQDHEYHGHLSSKVVGKHVDVLKAICKNDLHKSWVKNFSIGQAYCKFKYSNLEFAIGNLKQEIANFDKTIFVKKESWGIYHTIESALDFDFRIQQHELSKTQAKNLLSELEEKFVQVKNEISLVKLKVFNEHNTQF